MKVTSNQNPRTPAVIIKNSFTIIFLFLIYQLLLTLLLLPSMLHTSNLLKMLLLVGSTTLIIIFTLWLAYFYRTAPPIQSNQAAITHPLLKTLLLSFLFLPINYVNILVGNSTNQLNVQHALKTNLSLLFVIIILGPIIEELIFRGLMYRLIFYNQTTRYRILTAIIVTALTFAFAHTLSFNFFLIPYFLIACLLSYVYVKTLSLKYSLLLHILNNSLSAIGMLLIATQ